MLSSNQIRLIASDLTKISVDIINLVLTDDVIDMIRRDASGVETEEDIERRREALQRHRF